MAQPFSEETLALFERAERAIQHSMELRQLIAVQLERANGYWLEYEARRFAAEE
jgi:hypothetical protein